MTPTLDASFYLLTEIMSKLGSSQKDYHLEFFRRSITLVLESVKFMKLFESNEQDSKIALNEQSAGALERLSYILNNYFEETVSKIFGMKQRTWYKKQAVEEVKVIVKYVCHLYLVSYTKYKDVCTHLDSTRGVMLSSNLNEFIVNL